jgi:hypothetical protein
MAGELEKGFRLPRKFFPHAIVMIDHGACP